MTVFKLVSTYNHLSALPSCWKVAPLHPCVMTAVQICSFSPPLSTDLLISLFAFSGFWKRCTTAELLRANVKLLRVKICVPWMKFKLHVFKQPLQKGDTGRSVELFTFFQNSLFLISNRLEQRYHAQKYDTVHILPSKAIIITNFTTNCFSWSRGEWGQLCQFLLEVSLKQEDNSNASN